MAGPPAEQIAQELVDRFRCVLSPKSLLDREPELVVQFLLLGVRQTHEKPVLDLLAFRQRTACRVEALEDLLWVFVRVQSNAHHAKSLQSAQQADHVIAHHEPSNRSPRLSDGTRADAGACQQVAILALVATLKAELAQLVGRLARIDEPVGVDDLRSPTVALSVGTKPAPAIAARRMLTVVRRCCPSTTRMVVTTPAGPGSGNVCSVPP